MSKLRHDLTGVRFGRTVVTAFSHIKDGRSSWFCRCDCGNSHVSMAQSLKQGNTKSCGCLKLEAVRAKGKNRRHGLTKTREHCSWIDMRRRCYDAKREAYKNYGGRGIKICPQWESFEQFLLDMGNCPAGFELERSDVNGNYEPDNCRWASIEQQANNRRNNQMVHDSGGFVTIAQYAKARGLKYHAVYHQKVTRRHEAVRREFLTATHQRVMQRAPELVWDAED